MLYSVLLLPTVLLVFGLAVDIGLLQMQRVRLRWALDMATVDAATAVDAIAYTRTGRLRLDEIQAVDLTREYLYRNLARLGSVAGGDAGALAIARQAEVAVTNQVPAPDPFSGVTLDRPAVSARIRVPYRMAFLGAFIGQRNLSVTASAELKS